MCSSDLFPSHDIQFAQELRRKLTLASDDREVYRRASHEVSRKMVCAAEIDYKVEPEKMYRDTMRGGPTCLNN